jgi:SAM-dependent methyltransferase
MNKNLIHDRFAKNLKSYDENAKIQKRMAERLITFVQNKQPKKILEIGCGTGFLTQLINKEFKFESFMAIDIVKDCEQYIKNISSNIIFTPADIEEFITSNGEKAIYWLQRNENEFPKRMVYFDSNGNKTKDTLYIKDALGNISILKMFFNEKGEKIKSISKEIYNTRSPIQLIIEKITLRDNISFDEVILTYQNNNAEVFRRSSKDYPYIANHKVPDFITDNTIKFYDETGIVERNEIRPDGNIEIVKTTDTDTIITCLSDNFTLSRETVKIGDVLSTEYFNTDNPDSPYAIFEYHLNKDKDDTNFFKLSLKQENGNQIFFFDDVDDYKYFTENMITGVQ